MLERLLSVKFGTPKNPKDADVFEKFQSRLEEIVRRQNLSTIERHFAVVDELVEALSENASLFLPYRQRLFKFFYESSKLWLDNKLLFACPTVVSLFQSELGWLQQRIKPQTLEALLGRLQEWRTFFKEYKAACLPLLDEAPCFVVLSSPPLKELEDISTSPKRGSRSNGLLPSALDDQGRVRYESYPRAYQEDVERGNGYRLKIGDDAPIILRELHTLKGKRGVKQSIGSYFQSKGVVLDPDLEWRLVHFLPQTHAKKLSTGDINAAIEGSLVSRAWITPLQTKFEYTVRAKTQGRGKNKSCQLLEVNCTRRVYQLAQLPKDCEGMPANRISADPERPIFISSWTVNLSSKGISPPILLRIADSTEDQFILNAIRKQPASKRSSPKRKAREIDKAQEQQVSPDAGPAASSTGVTPFLKDMTVSSDGGSPKKRRSELQAEELVRDEETPIDDLHMGGRLAFYADKSPLDSKKPLRRALASELGDDGMAVEGEGGLLPYSGAHSP